MNGKMQGEQQPMDHRKPLVSLIKLRLSFISIILISFPSYCLANEATLDNFLKGRISETYFKINKPDNTLPLFQTSTKNCLWHPPFASDYPKDISYPRKVLANDLKYFNGVTPALGVSRFASAEPGGALESALTELLSSGSKSEHYKSLSRIESGRLAALDLPYAPGEPIFSSFGEFHERIVGKFYDNAENYKKKGFNFAVSLMGTGTSIYYYEKLYMITAAHIFTDEPSPSYHDIAIAPINRNRVIREGDDIGRHSISKSLSSKDLIGKRLSIFFNRDCSNYQNGSGVDFVQYIFPSFFNESTGEIYFNTPIDFGDYMGGVSGAGVFYKDKLVGIFLGIECFGGTGDRDMDCDGSPKNTKFGRFLGISQIRKSLEYYDEKADGSSIAIY